MDFEPESFAHGAHRHVTAGVLALFFAFIAFNFLFASASAARNVGLISDVVNPPPPIIQGTSFYVVCGFSNPAPNGGTWDCIHAYWNSPVAPANLCTFDHWNGNNGWFLCTGRPAGSYTALCTIDTTAGDNGGGGYGQCTAQTLTTGYSIVYTTISTTTSTSTSTTTILAAPTTTSTTTSTSTSSSTSTTTSTSTSTTSTSTTTIPVAIAPTPPAAPLACGFAQLDTNNWIGVNVLVVLFSITIGAFVYTIANFMSGERGGKLKGISQYEMIEAVFSAILIFAMFAISNFACQAGAALYGSASYSGIFIGAENYIGNLLFVNGVNLMTNMYATSIKYSLFAKVAYFFLDQASQFITGFISGSLLGVTLGFSTNINTLFSSYAGIFTNIYGTFLITSFAGLFLVFLLLPIVQAAALTVVAPISIIFRALAFTGPQLRKTANLFLAMAIGLYFVLPLTLAFNSYIVSCLNIQTQLGISNNACTNPVTGLPAYPFFSQYLRGYSVATVPISLFSGQSQLVTAPGATPSFIGQVSLVSSFYGSITNYQEYMTDMVDAPLYAEDYGNQVAAYLFVSVVLLAIDFGITMGFVAGLSRGLDGMSNLFGAGGFWQ